MSNQAEMLAVLDRQIEALRIASVMACDKDQADAVESDGATLAALREQIASGPVAWVDVVAPAVTVERETARQWADAGRPMAAVYILTGATP